VVPLLGGGELGGALVPPLAGGVLAGGVLGALAPPLHATPLSLKFVGLGFEPENAPLKPKLVFAPLASAPFQLSALTVTCDPVCVAEAFHALDTDCAPVKSHSSFQLPIAAPLFVTMTLPVKPVSHTLGMSYSILQAALSTTKFELMALVLSSPPCAPHALMRPAFTKSTDT
jgi:hypothetical protein